MAKSTVRKGETNPSANNNTNTNNNTNNVNVNVNVHEPKRRSYTKKKKETGWLTKAIVGGIIALAVSILAYKYNTGKKTSDSSFDTVQPGGQPIEGTKQN